MVTTELPLKKTPYAAKEYVFKSLRGKRRRTKRKGRREDPMTRI